VIKVFWAIIARDKFTRLPSKKHCVLTGLWMYVIIGSHFVPLEGKFFLISLVIVRITINVRVRQNVPKCPLNNDVYIVLTLVVKLSNTSTTFWQQVEITCVGTNYQYITFWAQGPAPQNYLSTNFVLSLRIFLNFVFWVKLTATKKNTLFSLLKFKKILKYLRMA
jgi:hypothetical protein